jgi:hypothetical protein
VACERRVSLEGDLAWRRPAPEAAACRACRGRDRRRARSRHYSRSKSSSSSLYVMTVRLTLEVSTQVTKSSFERVTR